MKPAKKGNKKLLLNRMTVANLDVLSMSKIQGGEVSGEVVSGDSYTTGGTKDLHTCITCPAEDGLGDGN